LSDLNAKLEAAHTKLADIEKAYDQSRQELELHQNKLREAELRSAPTLSEDQSADGASASLGEEIAVYDEAWSAQASKTQYDSCVVSKRR
jgi:hypothetical protein